MEHSQSGKKRGAGGRAKVTVDDRGVADEDAIEARADRIVGGKNRVIQTRKPRAKGWSDVKQTAFLTELAVTCNVKRSAASVGMSVGGAYNRRTRDAVFAARWQAALVRGYERLEELLLATALASLERVTQGEPDDLADGDDGAGGTVGDLGVTIVGDPAVPTAGKVMATTAASIVGDGGQDPVVANEAVLPGAGFVSLPNVAAVQLALAMLNQHRADRIRGRKRNQVHRDTPEQTDAKLLKLLDSLAKRRGLAS